MSRSISTLHPWLVLLFLGPALGCDGEQAPVRTTEPAREAVAPTAPVKRPTPAVTQPPSAPPREPVASNPKLLGTRPYELDLSATSKGNRPAPLVVYLHGYGATPAKLREVLGLAEIGRDEGAIIATPAGSREAGRSRLFWNATPACCDFGGAGVDDVTYLATVIDDARSRAAVDERRIFLVGYSNGGFMAHRLACELSDRIAGIVSVAGSTFTEEERCRPTEPVAVLQIHGDADPIVSYGGGRVLNRPEGPPHPAAVATVARWARLNGCQGAEPAAPIDLESDLAGPETEVLRHTGCRGGAAELWTVRGGDHFVAQSPAASRLILAFLRNHPKPPGAGEPER